MRRIISLASVSLYAVAVVAQSSPDEDPDLQKLSDELSGYSEGEGDYEGILENLLQTRSSQYNLNTVSREELAVLHILTDRQIDNLLTYREEQGRFLDVHELQVVPGFDVNTAARLLPHVHVKDPHQHINKSLLRRIFSEGNSYILTRYERTLETKKGFLASDGQPPPFRGSPDKCYMRFRSAMAHDFSIGITGEKDAGERFSFNPRDDQLGFDFTSYHLQLKNKGIFTNLIAGDFQAQFGQGLLLGGAFGLGKGGESVSTTRRSNTGFLPYTSIHESAFQRGLAFTVRPATALSVSAFYSATRRDASAVDGADSVRSFQTTGYHRTESELASRKKVLEKSMGIVLQFDRDRLDAGVVVHAISFDVSLHRKPALYNQYAFSGSHNINAGVFVNYRHDNISLFSEFGQSVGAGRAGVAGVLFTIHPAIDIAIVYRNYMRNFYPFLSTAFSENSLPQNERGVYWGWKYRISRQYQLTGFVDLFTFPWLAFRRYTPSSGFEWLSRFRYEPSRSIHATLQVRQEKKSRNVAAPTNLYAVRDGLKSSILAEVSYGIRGNIRLKGRLQYNEYRLGATRTEGFALMQDITFSEGRFKISGRHAIYESGNYDNRHYVYEHDAWLSYSLPAYTGIGVRNYVLLEFKAHKRLTLWLRYARTRVIHSEEIGSGHDVIEGNTRNDVKFQARIRF